jgi:DNA-binding CsgD family transcriptional regulator/iron-sulfur cluster repair protein YtfE (RIC family)
MIPPHEPMSETIITGDMKMSDVIASDQRTMLLMPRFGIEMGFGDKTVRQLCQEQAIQTDFFLLMANTFLHQDYFPNKRLKNVDIKLLLRYLANAHDHYIREKIPHLESLFERFIAELPPLAKSQLEKFFREYIREVVDHIEYEEKTVFPYINELVRFAEHHPTAKTSFNYGIKEFEEKHNDIEEKLSDLKNLLVKYFPYDNNRYLRILILNELFDLEQDLINHARLEDKVLIPIVEELEKLISENKHIKHDASSRILHKLNTNIQVDQSEVSNSCNQLSSREVDVLKLLVKGFSNKEVSNTLFISTHTVMSHRKNISRKLNIRSVAGLTVYAILNGIINMDELK